MKMLCGQQKYIITIAYTEVYGWLFILIATKSAGDTREQEKQTNTKMLQSKNASDIKVHFPLLILIFFFCIVMGKKAY